MFKKEVTNAVLVLAAGESRRFGSAKQLAQIEGEPMLRHVVRHLLSPDDYQLIVVLGARAESIRPVISDLDIEVVVNTEWEKGMASSLQAGLTQCELRYPHLKGLIVVLADQWKLDKMNLKSLLSKADANPNTIIATDYDGHPGVPVCIPREKWDLLRSPEGDIGAKQLLASRTDVVLVQLPEARIDLDYPDSPANV